MNHHRIYPTTSFQAHLQEIIENDFGKVGIPIFKKPTIILTYWFTYFLFTGNKYETKNNSKLYRNFSPPKVQRRDDEKNEVIPKILGKYCFYKNSDLL